MIPNPIRRVLSVFRKHQVRALLMGGQACVFYGAAQFSRDVDFALLCDAPNLERLAAALRELAAECVAVPPLTADYLRRGHAVHFRCHASAAASLRIDVMSTMRGVDPFPVLWERRTTLADLEGETWDILDDTTLERALVEEELAERARDREYWRPLRAELERLRHPRD